METRLSNPKLRAKLRDTIQAKIRADGIRDLSDAGLTAALKNTISPRLLTRIAIELRDAGELEAAP